MHGRNGKKEMVNKKEIENIIRHHKEINNSFSFGLVTGEIRFCFNKDFQVDLEVCYGFSHNCLTNPDHPDREKSKALANYIIKAIEELKPEIYRKAAEIVEKEIREEKNGR